MMIKNCNTYVKKYLVNSGTDYVTDMPLWIARQTKSLAVALRKSRLHFKIETIESIAQNFGIVDYIHETTPLIWYERGLWADRQNCV